MTWSGWIPLGIAAVVLYVIARRLVAAGTPRYYSGVRGVIGYQGEGKSYLLAELALDALRRGAEVWTNFGVRGWWRTCPCSRPSQVHDDPMCMEEEARPLDGVTVVTDYRELLRIPPPKRDRYGRLMGAERVILWDEAHLSFPARASMSMARVELADLLMLWSYARKSGLAVYWGAQSEKLVDVLVRYQTVEVIVCRRVGPEGRPFAFVRSRWMPGEAESGSAMTRQREAQRLGFGVRRFDLRVARAYDTYEAIATSQGLRERLAAGESARSAGSRREAAPARGRIA